MYIKKIILNNFRNYEKEVFELSSGTNIICGNNAQGKTNILEAVYMFALGKSPRAKTDKELIRFGAEYSRISLDFETEDRSFDMRMQLLKSGKKSVLVNNVPLKKLSQLMNYLNVVMFSPDDLEMVKGSPHTRRTFADSVISQMYPMYLQSLIRCHRNTAQKNALLKKMKITGVEYDPTLSVWNEQIAEDSACIVKYRREFAESINGYASRIQSDISGERLEFSYEPSVDGDKSKYFERLEEAGVREIKHGTSVVGTGRDEFSISINSKPARLFASQGQQRTSVLSLKIASAELMHEKKDEYPVLLLDDIMSELDSKRREYLSEKIENKQVLITCTDAEAVLGAGDKMFRICAGKIV